MRKLPAIFGQVFSMTGGAIAAKAIGMVKGVVLARLLGPGGYGTLNALSLITTYSEHANLGVVHAMSRDMPIAIGAGDRSRADRIAHTSLGFSLIAGIVVALGVLAVAAFAALAPGMRLLLACMAVMVVSLQLVRFLQVLARVEMRFHSLASLRVGDVLLQLVFAVTLGLLFGLPGAVGGMVLGQVLVAAVAWRSIAAGIGLGLDRELLRPLLRLGLALIWITSLYTLLHSIDRLLIIKWLGAEQLGIYAIALLAVSLMAFVPGAVGLVISPRMMRLYGQGASTERVGAMLQEPILLLSLLLPLMGGVGAVLVPAVVTRVLPAFSAAVLPAQILLLSYTPFAARSFAGEVLLGSDLISRIAILQVAGLIIAVTIELGAILLGYGIVGVACGTAAVYCFFGVSMVITALRTLGKGTREILRFLAQMLLPSLWIALAVVAGSALLRYLDLATTSITGTAVTLLVLVLAALPITWQAYRRLRSLRARAERLSTT